MLEKHFFLRTLVKKKKGFFQKTVSEGLGMKSLLIWTINPDMCDIFGKKKIK